MGATQGNEFHGVQARVSAVVEHVGEDATAFECLVDTHWFQVVVSNGFGGVGEFNMSPFVVGDFVVIQVVCVAWEANQCVSPVATREVDVFVARATTFNTCPKHRGDVRWDSSIGGRSQVGHRAIVGYFRHTKT